MLTKLRIQRFKAWRDTGELRLAPLTVLFGVNSAGKSSITQLLLALKQTVESPDRRRVLHPGDQNTVVELGTFNDMVFAHDTDSSIVFNLSWRLPNGLVVNDPKSTFIDEYDRVGFEAEISQVDSRVQVNRFRYVLGEGQSSALSGELSVAYEKRESTSKTGRFELRTSPYELVRNPGRVWHLPPPIRFYGFPDEALAYYQNSGFIADLALELEQLFGRLYYLGPLRQSPARGYIWSGEVPAHAGWQGERTIEAILAASDRLISAGYKKKARPFQAVVARWLLEMGLVHDFSVKPIAKHRKEFEVKVRTSPSSAEAHLPDVGFGISQVLPVIVECFYPPPNSTIVLEQPEIHLHPQVQKVLADLFIEAIQAREEGENRGVQLLVESHSEHFLHRLLRRIAENKVQPGDVAIYFCRPGGDGSTIEELRVGEDGSIANWPENFFGDEMEDIAGRMDAALGETTPNEQRESQQQDPA